MKTGRACVYDLKVIERAVGAKRGEEVQGVEECCGMVRMAEWC